MNCFQDPGHDEGRVGSASFFSGSDLPSSQSPNCDHADLKRSQEALERAIGELVKNAPNPLTPALIKNLSASLQGASSNLGSRPNIRKRVDELASAIQGPAAAAGVAPNEAISGLIQSLQIHATFYPLFEKLATPNNFPLQLAVALTDLVGEIFCETGIAGSYFKARPSQFDPPLERFAEIIRLHRLSHLDTSRFITSEQQKALEEAGRWLIKFAGSPLEHISGTKDCGARSSLSSQGPDRAENQYGLKIDPNHAIITMVFRAIGKLGANVLSPLNKEIKYYRGQASGDDLHKLTRVHIAFGIRFVEGYFSPIKLGDDQRIAAAALALQFLDPLLDLSFDGNDRQTAKRITATANLIRAASVGFHRPEAAAVAGGSAQIEQAIAEAKQRLRAFFNARMEEAPSESSPASFRLKTEWNSEKLTGSALLGVLDLISDPQDPN